MTTRCTVEIWAADMRVPTVSLYHHTDGDPGFMGPKLERFMKYIMKVLPYRHDEAATVAAMLVKLSSDNYDGPVEPNTGPVETWIPKNSEVMGARALIPFFHPTCVVHWDIAYLWRVKLGKVYAKNRGYKIECYVPSFDYETGEVLDLRKVNWKAEAKKRR
jgi:hypothetical protein